jgi:hypothetical protein
VNQRPMQAVSIQETDREAPPLAAQPDTDQLASLARVEIRRLTGGWRQLLLIHQPTDDGRCPTCSRWFHRKRWPCQVWLAAHQHLIGENPTVRTKRPPRRILVRRRQLPVPAPPSPHPPVDAEITEPLPAYPGPAGLVELPGPRTNSPVPPGMRTSGPAPHTGWPALANQD